MKLFCYNKRYKDEEDIMSALLKIKNGDEKTLEKIIYDTYPKIYSYILRRLRNVTIALDLTQETYLKFMKQMYQLPSDTKVENYLYRIAYHLCIDYYRIYKREEEVMEVPSKEKLPMEVILQKEKENKIKKALDCLSEEQRNVVILRYYQELKIKEIACILNEKENTIKTRLRLGTKKLKQILERSDYIEY